MRQVVLVSTRQLGSMAKQRSAESAEFLALMAWNAMEQAEAAAGTLERTVGVRDAAGFVTTRNLYRSIIFALR